MLPEGESYSSYNKAGKWRRGSGLRVNFNYLSLILIIMNIGDDTWCTIFLSMFLPIWGDGFYAVECDRCDGYGGV